MHFITRYIKDGKIVEDALCATPRLEHNPILTEDRDRVMDTDNDGCQGCKNHIMRSESSGKNINDITNEQLKRLKKELKQL